MLGTFVLIGGGMVVAFFVYDASTYRDNPDVEDIRVRRTKISRLSRDWSFWERAGEA
jgi:NADH dehydrogenase